MKKQTNPKLDRKKGLYLKYTEEKGRGVFCTTDIRKGEQLEVTPALILNRRETSYADRTILCNYTFSLGGFSNWLRRIVKLKNPDQGCAVVMGVGSFCNDDKDPNAEIVWEEINGSLYYTLTATKRIPKGTEICTTYGRGWFDDKNHR